MNMLANIKTTLGRLLSVLYGGAFNSHHSPLFSQLEAGPLQSSVPPGAGGAGGAPPPDPLPLFPPEDDVFLAFVSLVVLLFFAGGGGGGGGGSFAGGVFSALGEDFVSPLTLCALASSVLHS